MQAQSLPTLPVDPSQSYVNFNLRKANNGYIVTIYRNGEFTYVFESLQVALNFIQENI